MSRLTRRMRGGIRPRPRAALNRRIHRAYNRVRDGNFSIDGLLGFDLHEKTVGVVGTGKIGRVFSGLLTGFGVHLLGYDLYQSREFTDLGGKHVDLHFIR